MACFEPPHAPQPRVHDFIRLGGVETQSILGAHDGALPDDLMDLLEDATA